MKISNLVILAVAGIFIVSAASAQQKAVPQSRAQVYLSYAPLVKKAAPAVVNIYTRKVVRTRQMTPLFNDPFFRRFFGEGFGFNVPSAPRKRVQNSLGSGVIVKSDGVIITNQHVIEGADEIRVVLTDRREFDATVIGVDERTDLAILRIDIEDEKLPYLEFSNSDDLEVGDIVLAIGNPFGVGQTVTSGIISALARTQTGISDLNSFIQTDAAINPGNSGGALIGIDGRLVGVNTAIFSKSGGSLGIGFAIPSNMVRAVLSGVTENGKLVRPWLGAWGQTVSADLAATLGMKRPVGILIVEVYPNGQAWQAGLRVNDVVVSVDGHDVNGPEELSFRIATLQIGETTTMNILRRGNVRTLTLNLLAPPEIPSRDSSYLTGSQPLSGARVANMSPALSIELGMGRIELGVTIIAIKRRSSAHRLRFKLGDVIVRVNGVDISSVASLRRALAHKVDQWRISIKRNGKLKRVVIDR